MKFQRSAPRVLIFSVVLVVIGMAVLSNRLFSGLTSAVERDQFELIRALWSYNLTAAQNRALERAEMIATMPAVREAFAARDRERLLAQCAEMFKRQKRALRRRSSAVPLPTGGLILAAARARSAWRPPGPVPAHGRRGQS